MRCKNAKRAETSGGTFFFFFAFLHFLFFILVFSTDFLPNALPVLGAIFFEDMVSELSSEFLEWLLIYTALCLSRFLIGYSQIPRVSWDRPLKTTVLSGESFGCFEKGGTLSELEALLPKPFFGALSSPKRAWNLTSAGKKTPDDLQEKVFFGVHSSVQLRFAKRLRKMNTHTILPKTPKKSKGPN